MKFHMTLFEMCSKLFGEGTKNILFKTQPSKGHSYHRTQ